jgi:hypothetical protein
MLRRLPAIHKPRLPAMARASVDGSGTEFTTNVCEGLEKKPAA